MVNIFKIICLSLLLFLPSLASGQEDKVNLTSILEELSNSMGVEISYSPNFTNEVYITTSYHTSESVDETLNLVLFGTGLAFKKLGEDKYYLYKKTAPKDKPKPVKKAKKAVPPPVVRPPRDTSVISKPPCSFSLAEKTDLSYISPLPYLDLRQKPIPPEELPWIMVKVNGLALLTTTLNYGIELGLSQRLSLDLSSSINGWSLGKNATLNHYGIQPEFRVWCKERFKGSFFGANLFTYYYNIGGIGFIEGLNDYRYQGLLFGTGVSYGYHYSFCDRWAIEANIGLGYAHIIYHKSSIGDTYEMLESGHYNYFGLTKLGLSIIYRIK